jgi:hypothetical protein
MLSLGEIGSLGRGYLDDFDETCVVASLASP